MAGLMPFYILREFESNGKFASGGRIYTYESGTNTPKTTYRDAGLTIPHENPIILSASGSAVVFLADGAYGLLVTTSTGAQIEGRVDGVVGTGNSGAGTGSNSSFVTLRNYDDLRALSTVPDTVYVTGRLTDGDGGAGWFQRIPASTLTDDDGVILTSASGTNVYKRIFDSVIDGQWYGLTYGVSIDQTIYMNKALIASNTYNYPLQITGSIYINQNLTVPNKSALIATDDGFFTATLNVTITFADDSEFSAYGRTFGTNVNAVFGKRTSDLVKLSWFGGSVDDVRVSKWFASVSANKPAILLDEVVNVAMGNISTNAPFNKTIGSYFNIDPATSAMTISFTDMQDAPDKLFQIPNAVVTSNVFFSIRSRPEWFGAIKDDANDDSHALRRASQSSNGVLLSSGTYRYLTTVTWPTTVSFYGEGTIFIATDNLITTTNLALDGCNIELESAGNWATATTFTAINASFPSTYTATTKSITGCVYTNDFRFPVSEGNPGLYNPHLPLILNSGGLATDNVGKIYDCTIRPNITIGGNVSYVVNDNAWSTGIFSVSLKIAPITDKIAHIAAVVIWNISGNLTPFNTKEFAYVEFDSADPAIKDWLISPFYSGQIDQCFRDDTITVYDTVVPTIVRKEGRRFVFGNSKGLGGRSYSGTMVTPNPYMGWGTIWPRMNYSTAFVQHQIGWSGLLVKP